MLIISEWRTDEWHFKSRNPKVNEFNSITLLTNDWNMEVIYGIPYPYDLEDELTGVLYRISFAENVYAASKCNCTFPLCLIASKERNSSRLILSNISYDINALSGKIYRDQINNISKVNMISE